MDKSDQKATKKAARNYMYPLGGVHIFLQGRGGPDGSICVPLSPFSGKHRADSERMWADLRNRVRVWISLPKTAPVEGKR